MKTVIFKALTSSQVVLFPENLGDRIPSNHPVRLVSTVVDELYQSEVLISPIYTIENITKSACRNDGFFI